MSRLTPDTTKTYHATSPTIVRISLADAFSAEVPVTPRTPAFVHHDFLNEAEVFIFSAKKSIKELRFFARASLSSIDFV